MPNLRESQLLSDYLTEMTEHLRTVPAERREEELHEVQDHLESTAAALCKEGLCEDAAMETALAQFGPAKTAAQQFVVAWRRGERKKKVTRMKKYVLFGTSLTIVVMAAAWLLFAVSMTYRILTPKGQVLIHASNGASLKVQQGAVQILAAGDSGTGMEHLNNSAFVPAVAVPFVVIFGFALMGCCSVLRPRRVA